MPGFVSPYASAVTGNRLRPFPSTPLRTGLDTFASSGSPVALSFDWFLLILVCPRRSSGVDRDVASLADDEGLAPSVSATFSVDGEERLGSLHFASLHVPAIGSPTPLCQVSGFPGLELLWGFRRPGGNEREVLTHPERLILTHLVLQDSRSGQGRQLRFTPPFGSSWTSSTRESGSSRRSSRRSGNDASGGPKAPRSSARPGRSGSTR